MPQVPQEVTRSVTELVASAIGLAAVAVGVSTQPQPVTAHPPPITIPAAVSAGEPTEPLVRMKADAAEGVELNNAARW